MGQKTFVAGDKPSDANLVKLSGNFLIAATIESLSEAIALIRKSGMDAHRYAEILIGTLFSAPVYKSYGALIADLPPNLILCQSLSARPFVPVPPSRCRLRSAPGRKGSDCAGGSLWAPATSLRRIACGTDPEKALLSSLGRERTPTFIQGTKGLVRGNDLQQLEIVPRIFRLGWILYLKKIHVAHDAAINA
jgi:hypothetical protein